MTIGDQFWLPGELSEASAERNWSKWSSTFFLARPNGKNG
jgi:hypothetical protein